MSIDNFIPLAQFIALNDVKLTDDNFYFLQLIQRKKDGNTRDGVIVKDFYIKNSQDLLAKANFIKQLCTATNSRAYFNPNVKSYKKCATHMLIDLSHLLKNEHYTQTKGLFNSAAGQVATRDSNFEKVWIIDQDDDSFTVDKVIMYLHKNNIQYTLLWTVNGAHFLTLPFRVDTSPFPAKMIQKHNPTLLFYEVKNV